MKIAYLSASFIPSRDANSIHVMNICDAISELGHEVVLIAPNAHWRTDKEVDNLKEYYGIRNEFEIKWLPFSKRWYAEILYAVCILFYLARHRPDKVVGRFLHGCFFATMLRIPTSFDSHAPIWLKGRLATFLFNRMVRSKPFERLVMISHALKRIYKESSLVCLKDAQIEIAPMGSHVYDSRTVELPGLNRVKAGYLGHLYKGRGMEIILNLSKSLPEVDFIVIGGTESDVDFWKGEASGIDNLYLLGFVPPSQIYTYRNSCDFLLAPYQIEVAVAGGKGDISQFISPIKLVEYMSSGKAIIVSDLPVLREILTHAHTALFCKPDSVQEWKEAILRLQNNQELANRLGERAFEEFRSKYTWEKRAETLIGV